MTAMTFMLDDTALMADYDEVADILYLWIEGPRPAVTFETSAGHLVQLDPDSRELVGVTVMDYGRAWEGKTIELEVPVFEQRTLQPA